MKKSLLVSVVTILSSLLTAFTGIDLGTKLKAQCNANSYNTGTSCKGISDGQATAYGYGGTSPYSFLWSNGQTTSTINNLANGVYTCIVTDNTGCSTTVSATISQYVVNLYYIANTGTSCKGNDAQLTAYATGGAYPYSFIWSNGKTGNTISGLSNGSYNVTVTDANGCTGTGNAVVAPYTIYVYTSNTGVSCNANNDAQASVSASGGAYPYSYVWSNGKTGSVISNLTLGANYIVTATDANGCVATNSTTVGPFNLTAYVSNTGVSCKGGNDASASASASGGFYPYSYVWSNGKTGYNITGLGLGTYTVIATDASGCTKSASTTIAPYVITAYSYNSGLSCKGTNDAQASAGAYGGAYPYTYSWSNGKTGYLITGLAGGIYSVTVSDANGCVKTSTTSVAPYSITVYVSNTGTSCSSPNDGVASAGAYGGAYPYYYLWNNGKTGGQITGLSGGVYSVTVSDANGCIKTATTSISPYTVYVYAGNTSISCNSNNDGTAYAGAYGGSSPYSFVWSNGMTGANLSGLTVGGYTVTATDNKGCTNIATTSVGGFNMYIYYLANTGTSCKGNDGTATAYTTGGVYPYTYIWSNGKTGQVVSGLSTGSFNVTVTDVNGCSSSTSFTVVPYIITAYTSNTGVSCNSTNDAKATANAYGGTYPYSYVWSNGMTGAGISGLSVGGYTVTATDANGCTNIATALVGGFNMVVYTSATGISCKGNDGQISAYYVSGATPPYSYSWSNGKTGQIVTGLSTGTYVVTVTDANGCTKTNSTSITAYVVNVYYISSTNLTCNAGGNGSAYAYVTGGTYPYSYLWSNGKTGITVTGLAAGTYTVWATDNNGCSGKNTISITQPPAINVSVSSFAPPCGSATGAFTVTATSGSQPYQFSNDGGSIFQSLPNFGSLNAGTYAVVVKDNNGCTVSSSVILNSTGGVTAQIISSNSVTCNGSCNGSATVGGTGGTQPYSYSWSNGNTTASINNACSGNYQVVITDGGGCVNGLYVNIGSPAVNTVNISGVNVSCSGGSNSGSAAATAGGGSSPYSFVWSNGPTTSAINNIPAGNYTVTVTDKNGCFVSGTKTITAPATINVSTGSSNATCNQSNGSASAVATGGIAPYSYSWNNGKTGATINNVAAANYIVTVTDAGGCTATNNVSVSNSNGVSAQITLANPVACFGLCNGYSTASGTGGSAPYSFMWSNGKTSATIYGMCAGNYTVTITDGSGCTSAVVSTITAPSAALGVIATGSGSSAVANASGGTAPYSYSWDNGKTAQTLTGLTAGSYTVTVVDNNGCTAKAKATVTGTAGIEESSYFMNVLVVPNPNDGNFEIRLSLSDASNAQLTITNLVGEVVYSKQVSPLQKSNLQLDMSNFAKSVYIITLQQHEHISRSKVIVQ